ncbi:hypothetical protein RJ639_046420 [Escallonia herrerae]|uniref:Uncharacterized protein n=1 Tax=Escallonia herrerae TaxID=1293975 RepID=A0AA89AY45_9ASTE|nr:hypothetical protein RJ639_046420 [Escallonia herrerae]
MANIRRRDANLYLSHNLVGLLAPKTPNNATNKLRTSHNAGTKWSALPTCLTDKEPTRVKDEKEKKVCELTAELESTNQRCEVYRANLLAVLRDMEDQKLKLSVKVQSARLSLKE